MPEILAAQSQATTGGSLTEFLGHTTTPQEGAQALDIAFYRTLTRRLELSRPWTGQGLHRSQPLRVQLLPLLWCLAYLFHRHVSSPSLRVTTLDRLILSSRYRRRLRAKLHSPTSTGHWNRLHEQKPYPVWAPPVSGLTAAKDFACSFLAFITGLITFFIAIVSSPSSQTKAALNWAEAKESPSALARSLSRHG